MKILIIGLGSIAKKHINAVRELKIECDVYALRSSNISKTVDGVINLYSIEELKNYKFEFAIISNPTHLHSKYISLLSELGISLFIEKPAVHDIKIIDELSVKIKNYGIKTYVACNLRFHPCIRYLKNNIEKNCKINEVNIYCGSYLPDWRSELDFRKNYSVSHMMGGGVHLDLFHEIDYTYWLFGKPISTRNFKSSKSTLEIEAFDYANFLLIYKNFNVSIILNYYRKDPRRLIEIVFNDDTWTINILNNTILNNKSEIIFQDNDFNILDTYRDQMLYFIEKISSNQIPMNSFSESINPLKIALNND
jgi:predicted dehydrogenase